MGFYLDFMLSAFTLEYQSSYRIMFTTKHYLAHVFRLPAQYSVFCINERDLVSVPGLPLIDCFLLSQPVCSSVQ